VSGRLDHPRWCLSAVTKPFIHDDVLLDTARARDLYHRFAAGLPIIDYHCHLSPADIAAHRRFANLTEIWLATDHYKWRAMRTCGVDEHFITGPASDWEKFQKWASTVPKLLRNPLYHWTHLELRRPFGITDRLLNADSAASIWNDCNALLQTAEYSTTGILATMNVEIVCTTDDPIDDLRFHQALASDGTCSTRVYPAFRPDRAMAVGDPIAYRQYLERLGAAAGLEIRTYDDLLDALHRRHDAFHQQGCRISDHGLETIPSAEPTPQGARHAFARVLGGATLAKESALELEAAILHELALMNHARGWVQQLHLGALRNNNTRMLRQLGPDSGFDSIGDFEIARPLARFLDALDADDRLAKTVLYNLNPRDNELMATMIGNFQDGSCAGKLQYGAAWWFLDQLDGMQRQLEALSNMSVLSQWVGMLTDSRSFLSYPRHEYFRRLLCNILGREMTCGLLPDDLELVGGLVRDACYHNARRYFEWPHLAAPQP
jgi:glucuronate isomerase